MILSNAAIHRALDERRLIIEPEPWPRDPAGAEKSPYQTTSVDLRLGNQISFFKKDLPFDINLNQGSFANLFGANSETNTISNDCPFILKPNRLVLGRTPEKVKLPLLEDGRICLGSKGRAPTRDADYSYTSPRRRFMQGSQVQLHSNSSTSGLATFRCILVRPFAN